MPNPPRDPGQRPPPTAEGGQEGPFLAARPLLLSVAYRMTGSRDDAEDLVQDAWMRWQGAPAARVADPTSYLVRVVTRLAIDHYRARHAMREQYVGPWLPEPLLDADEWIGPLEAVERREQLALATLALYERLTPLQRAVTVLRDAFGYSYAEIAAVVGPSPAACRQAHRRARAHLGSGVTARGDTEQHAKLLQALLAAFASGNLQEVEAILAAEVVLVSDGGGEVTAALRPIVGANKVARFLIGLLGQAPPGTAVRVADVNGWPGLVALRDGEITHVVGLAVGDRIEHIAIVRNPKKLGSAGRAHHNP